MQENNPSSSIYLQNILGWTIWTAKDGKTVLFKLLMKPIIGLIFLGLFLVILAFILLASKADKSIQPCSQTLIVHSYKNGRLVGSKLFKDGNFWVSNGNYPAYNGMPACDSITIDIYIPPTQKK